MADDNKDDKTIADKANNAYVDGKKKIKDAWVDTKATAEKAENEVEAEADKR